MATGIISVDLRGRHPAFLSTALLYLAIVCYRALVTLYLWRLLAFPTEMRSDLADPRRGFGFFTFVAGTDVPGTPTGRTGQIYGPMVDDSQSRSEARSPKDAGEEPYLSRGLREGSAGQPLQRAGQVATRC